MNKVSIIPVIIVDNKVYAGKDHGEAITKAANCGENISGIDRERDGKFLINMKEILNRNQTKERYGVYHSSDIK